MNILDYILIAVIAGCIIAAVAFLVGQKKKGKSISCIGCSGCSSCKNCNNCSSKSK